MRMLGTLARICIGALCGFLLLSIMGHSMWDEGESDLSELSSSNLATELLTDWSVPVVILGVLLAMAMVVNVRNAFGDRKLTDLVAWKRAVWGAPLGLVAGVVVLALLDESTLAIAVSSFVLGAVALQLVGLRSPTGVISQYLAGTATAFSSTVAALPGPMFVIFHGHRDAGAVRGTMASFMLVASPVILTILAFDGRFNLRHLSLAAMLCPGMFVGLMLGRVLRPLINGSWFRFAILGVASSSAIAVLIREIVF